MTRRKSNFGPDLTKVINHTPSSVLRAFLSGHASTDGHLIRPPSPLENVSPDEDKKLLSAFLADLDKDLLSELDNICVSLLAMSEDKGQSSLETVASKRLFNTDFDKFEEQPDALCRSIWTQVQFPDVFQDAESFYAARRYREHKKMYTAFEVDQSKEVPLSADLVAVDNLCSMLDQSLQLKAKSSASVIDLPKTADYPPSVMVALRHPGALSSIKDHREDGGWRTYYYRPSNEAVLIYTPGLKRIEVCAESFGVRSAVSNLFAEVVLKQNLSEKPLTRCNFNLERFRQSFDLDLPDFDDVEIGSAVVVEAEMPLGDWARRLNLKVTKEDNIEEVLSRYLFGANKLIRKFGFSKVAIAVGYVRRSDGKSGTFRIVISGGNSSNVQSQNDPFLRDLGYRLLTTWGLLDELRVITDSETAQWFQFLLSLYDLPGDEVSGAFLETAGVNPQNLLDLRLIERKSRQVLVLIDDEENDDVLEGELSAGPVKGTLRTEGAFGEELGASAEAPALIYRINQSWLGEMVLKGVSNAITVRNIEIIDNNLALVGKLSTTHETIPVYIAKNLGDPKVINSLDVTLRQRGKNGNGIVLAVSENPPRYLGPNVVIPLKNYLSTDVSEVKLDLEAIQTAFDAGRTLVSCAQSAQVIQHANQTATLILPGSEPLHLDGANQIAVFQRLVDATANGNLEVRSTVLTDGMGSTSPRQLFNKARWTAIEGVYISQGSSNRFWRLGAPMG